MEETRSVKEIVLSFNKTVNSMLNQLEKRCVSEVDMANVDRLKKRVSLLRKMVDDGGRVVLEKAGKFLNWYGQELIERNEEFFLKLEMNEEKVDKEDEFAISLMSNIKKMYKAAKQKERDILWQEVLSLYTDFIGYCMITGKDPENPEL